ncbi:MAG: NAD(P)H-hydrate dehydratase [Clostridia bacterium]|nr:NAD(P)H-hydrate dehydratase [Clostridia bacterium]
MERILTSAQMRAADRYTIDVLGVSEEILIERAGKAVSDEIVKKFPGGRVLVCVGKGNNGRDGKVIAENLSKIHGFSVSVLNFSLGALKFFERKYDIIVDCLFGTGLNREVTGIYRTVIEKINESGAYVVSCDIPSGLSADTGKPLGVAVKANFTVAIQEFKVGHFINDGPDYCGKIVAKDIGISIWGEDYVMKMSNEDVSVFFPKKKRNVHKGSFGKVCVFGGSKSFSGSSLLSFNALTALKMGNGYAYLCIPESLFSVYALKVPEIILKTCKDVDGFLQFDENLLNQLLAFDSIAFGMGVGVSEEVYKTIKYLLQNFKGNLLIDADGLNSLSMFGVDILKDKKCKVVLTPHVGEFSRLSGKSVSDIQDNFIENAKSFAKKYGVTVLLKSSTSVITDGEKTFLNITGCSGLAKGGSGDVLSGVVLGLLNEKDFTESVVAASYIFGTAAEFACKTENDYTLTASDVVRFLPQAIEKVM